MLLLLKEAGYLECAWIISMFDTFRWVPLKAAPSLDDRAAHFSTPTGSTSLVSAPSHKSDIAFGSFG